jgi:alkanesulfonate monooxygenase SsuD/methylene tetrahydromethanopterin reductase-like flavin-dependent oxidoreductase (luciferase family)
MRRLITDEMVETIGVVGDPEHCADEISQRFGSRAREVCCYFPGYDPTAEHVADLVRALHSR